MSGTIEVDVDQGGSVTRRSRSERPERQATHSEEAPAVETALVDQISPEEAVADSQRQLEEANRQVADARRAARESENRRIAAERSAQQANTARVTDRVTVVASAVESAKSEQAAARAALRMAREAGDVEAEINATEALSGATYRLSQSTAELEWLKANPPQQQQTQTPAVAGTDERSQRWLDDHPRYYTDEGYRSTAEGADASAVRAGHPRGSENYIRHIDQIMNRVYGDGHDKTGNGGQTQVDRGQAPRNGGASGAVPPSRGGGSNAGYKTVDTLFGPVGVRYDSQGRVVGLKPTSAAQQENFEEGAKTTLHKLYEKDPGRALSEYILEHIQIGRERAAGENGGLVIGEGDRLA